MSGPDRSARALVGQRDNWCCQRCGRPAQHVHHRRPRALGGSTRADVHAPQNLICLCLDCHAQVESKRTAAYLAGFLVHQAHDPLEVAVCTRWGWRYLQADGNWRVAS